MGFSDTTDAVLTPLGLTGKPSPASLYDSYKDAVPVFRKKTSKIPGDRFQLAMFNAMNGDMDMALKAMVDPFSVPPAYQGELGAQVDQLLPDADHSILGAVRRIATNPMTMFALTMGQVLPVGTKEQIRTYLSTSQDYSRRMGFLLRSVSGPNELFRDRKGRMTVAGDALFKMNVMIDQERERYARLLNEARVDYERLNGGPMTKAGTVRLSLILEKAWEKDNPVWRSIRMLTNKDVGPVEITPTDAEARMVNAINVVRNDYYQTVLKTLSGPQFTELRKELSRHGLFARSPGEASVETYFPHYLHVDKDKLAFDISSLVKEGRIDDAIALSNPLAPRQAMNWYQYRDQVLAGPQPSSLRARGLGTKIVDGDPRLFNMLLPSPSHLKEVEGLLKPGSIEAVQEILSHPDRYRVNGTDVNYSTHSMDSLNVWGRYIDAMSRFKAWTLSGQGKRLQDELPTMRHQNPELANLMETVYMPMIQGLLTPAQFTRAAAWETAKVNWIRTLQTSPFFAEGAGKKVADWLTKSLIGNGPLASRIGMEGAVSSWLYMGALGANVGSSFNNLMQTVATTIPKLGYKSTMAGVWQTLQQLHEYGQARLNGEEQDRAFQRVFSNFMKAGLDKDPTTGGQAFKRALDQAWTKSAFVAGADGVGKVTDRVKAIMMAPFTSVERWNWLVAFNGAQHSAKTAGLSPEEGVKYGRQVVEETQFMSGPMMAPSATAQWSGPMRMFTQFPLRLASFFGNALSRGVGQALAGEIPSQLGVLARAAGASGVAKEFARSFGLDVSGGMAWEGLPFPTSDRPFSPFPVVPPLLAIGGAAAMDVAGGKFDKTRYVWPMLVPGGLAASKALSMLSSKMAQYTGRQYIDYNRPDEQGRYPMMTASGQLIQYLTPTQLLLQGMGMKPYDVTQEQEYMKYLMEQRDQIKAIRETMIQGISNNDNGMIGAATQEWRRMYPNAPLPVQRSDIQMIQDRRMLMRTERVLSTLPGSVRASMAAAVPAAVASNIPNYFFDPTKRTDQATRDQFSPFIGRDMALQSPGYQGE